MADQFTPEERKRVNDLVADALDLPKEKRAGFVKSQCSDERILQEVFRLLEQADGSTDSMHWSRDRGPRAGETVGRYRLLSLLGQGATGEVYLAVRLDIGQKAAVKILRTAITDPHSEKRFEQEARLLAGLEHPNIVRLLDYGHLPDGCPYLAMEYVSEGNLRSWCDRERLSVVERILVFCKICDAVRYAHEQLVVHRDLKPENILISGQKEPKLVDFGLVRMLGLLPVLTTNTVLDVEIQEGIGGTFEYASPEQLVGGPISTASDVYGLGSVLYELLAGRVPLRRGDTGRETATQFIQRVRTEIPPKVSDVPITDEVSSRRKSSPAELRRALSPDLDAILNKALAKGAAERYGNAKLLRDDLAHYLKSEPVDARPASLGYRARLFVRRHRYFVAAGALLAVAAIAAGADITAQGVRLRADDAEKEANVKDIKQSATSVAILMDGVKRGCNIEDQRGSPKGGEAMKVSPIDTKFHSAKWQRVAAHLLLQTADDSARTQGYDLLEQAKTLFMQLKGEDPAYNGLDDELAAIDRDEKKLKELKWKRGLGIAGAAVPPQLTDADDSLEKARAERATGDLWLATEEKARAAADYQKALASYDESLQASPDPVVKAERDDCAKRLSQIQDNRK